VRPLQHSRIVWLGLVLVEERAGDAAGKHALLGNSGSNSLFLQLKLHDSCYGWFYLAPIGLFWILVIIALSGGISY
jgi:hypothetical protein